MPFIVLKRDDIPNGSAQVLDLFPNTAQRNYIYDPPGHTKYLRRPDPTAVTLRTLGGELQFWVQGEGLAAWFAVNVPATPVAFAQGTITVADALGTVGDQIAIAGAGTLTAVSGARTAGQPEYSMDTPATIDGIAQSITAAINDVFADALTATNGGGGVVTVDSDIAGVAGDAAITVTVTSGGHITKADLAGGVDGVPSTMAEANQNALDIMGQIQFGTDTVPGGLALADINGVISTGAITATQLTELLKVIAGARYVAPQGTITATGGVYGIVWPEGARAGFDYGVVAYRVTVNGGDLELSRLQGAIGEMLSPDFVHRGTAGQAIILYNDDGSLFT